MRAVDIIARKRDGRELATDEIRWFIRGVVDGTVADYQAAAWLMAIFWRGMSAAETVDLTRAMAESGRLLDLGDLAGRAVDKHSTGGVGDKTSLVAAPIAAACGVAVPKMSGRGLGSTGGTLDKLESIPGIRVDLSETELLRQVARIGLAIVGQSIDLAPADGRLYALRDVTATVESLPLIVSSILSKKLAGGAPAIVLDVKAGRGAFMETPEAAEALAEGLVKVGAACGRRVIAYLTTMDQPLGWAVGNALEIREVIDTLRGSGPPDLAALSLTLAAEMILQAGQAATPEAARIRAQEALASGAALERLRAMIAAQGGDARVIDAPELLPVAPIIEPVRAPVAGFIGGIDAGLVGRTMVTLGAGRAQKTDRIDHAVGAVFQRKAGAAVAPGEVLCTLHLSQAADIEVARSALLSAYTFRETPVEPPAVILRRIAADRSLG